MKLVHRIHQALSPLIYGDRLALVPPSVNANWPERQFLRQLLTQQRVDAVFDVGANVGQYAIELRLIGFRGPIFSFEPSSCFAALQQRAADDPDWHVFNVALGAEPGVATFHEMGASVFNSFLAPSTDETAAYAGANDIARTVTVTVETLATVLPRLQQQYGFRRPFLKMDTQGFDVQVFRGATAVHDRIVALQSELSIKRIYRDAPLWTDVIAEYTAAGFDLARLFAVNPTQDTLLECDCFMRNTLFA